MLPYRWRPRLQPAVWALGLVGVVALAGCGLPFGGEVSPPAVATPAATSTHAPAHHVPQSVTPHLGTPQVTTTTTPAPVNTPAPTGPGWLGVSVANPPSDWTVSGCEIINVLANTPAASAGLVGADNRIDPVGDVVSQVAAGSDTQPITSCAQFVSFMHGTKPGEQITLNYWHRQVIILGHWVARQVAVTLASSQNGGACPPPIRGTVSSPQSGSRIRITIEVVGPTGTVTVPAILDTGAAITMLPNHVLTGAGYTAYGQSGVSGVVPGATTSDYLYSLPAGSLRVEDQGTFVPLTTGTVNPVAGIPNVGAASLDRLIGPDVLTLGASLSVSGSTWTLTPPCGG